MVIEIVFGPLRLPTPDAPPAFGYRVADGLRPGAIETGEGFATEWSALETALAWVRKTAGDRPDFRVQAVMLALVLGPGQRKLGERFRRGFAAMETKEDKAAAGAVNASGARGKSPSPSPSGPPPADWPALAVAAARAAADALGGVPIRVVDAPEYHPEVLALGLTTPGQV
jgi:hypothetical protein